ncbi:MAG: DUF4403 family protein [Erythrobacter sp.]|nr:DUF4403 family protein [Erythrobacter sp.]
MGSGQPTSLQATGLALAAMIASLAGCAKQADAPEPPPRATDKITFPHETSKIALDLKVDLAGLERDLEADLPRDLLSFSRPDTVCVPPKEVDLPLFKVKTPKLKCDIEGKVRRGRLRVSGRGRQLQVRMPVKAEVVARDIADILKQETGTAALDLTLSMKVDLTRDWRLTSDVALDYAWSNEPGIDFLGKRITFTREADRALAPLRAKAAAALEDSLERLALKDAAERGWRAAHTVLELNRANPAVWGRITPESFAYGGYQISGRTMTIALGLEGVLETHVGHRPEPIEPAALPPLERLSGRTGFGLLKVPVVADYAVLEPVLATALARRAARPFNLGEYGSVKARFDKIEIYGTTANRIAVGIDFAAQSDLSLWKNAHGRVWLTARPFNAANSRTINFADMRISGSTDMVGEEILFALANSDELQAVIGETLRQNFEHDFAKLRTKIDRAIASRRDGPVAYSITVEKIDTGRIKAHGEGLHLPVQLRARIDAELVNMD